MDNADTELERSDEPIRHHFQEPFAEQQFYQQLVYTKFLTRSAIVNSFDDSCPFFTNVFQG